MSIDPVFITFGRKFLRNVKLRFSWPIHCTADYCELAVCNGDSFNFSLTVEPDVEIWHDAITVQENR